MLVKLQNPIYAPTPTCQMCSAVALFLALPAPNSSTKLPFQEVLKVKRNLLAVTILAAFLVGCAASAMRFGAPVPATAQGANTHIRPNVVTGPCYKPGGTDCASTYHFVHGSTTLSTDGACSAGSQCGFTG